MNCYDYRNAVSSIVWLEPERQRIERKLSGQEQMQPPGIAAEAAGNAFPYSGLNCAVILMLGILLNRLLKWICRLLI
ncbi:MAG: hypothetical protein IJL32_01055 [Oscillospiraceae bacterium]|nr:hypothetical protein [Oscillospiraceae bacterium]